MIHDDDPFAADPELRDPVRRFRGRLAAPVTIVTSGTDEPAGLTVSSLNVIQGETGLIQVVVGPMSDLWSSVAQTGRFVVHICRESDRHLAESFAGLRPSPGGPFSGVSVTISEWGPVLDDLGDRAYCSLRDRAEVGYSGLITGTIDDVEAADLADPLIYFRGRYRSLG
jgi:flavin reductase (DIM6/NTAB) family NADH-FMN oxidoreductase RutF